MWSLFWARDDTSSRGCRSTSSPSSTACVWCTVVHVLVIRLFLPAVARSSPTAS